MPKVLTITSRAIKDVSKPTPVFQLMPSGRIITFDGATQVRNRAMLQLRRPTMVEWKMSQYPHEQRDGQHEVPACRRKTRERSIKRKPTDCKVGHRYSGSSSTNGVEADLNTEDLRVSSW